MHNYTTPTLVFKIPIDTSALTEAFVTIKQKGDLKDVEVEKDISEMALEDYTLRVSLSQEDTGLFCSGTACEIQLRVKDASGNSYASRIFTLPVEAVLKKGVI